MRHQLRSIGLLLALLATVTPLEAQRVYNNGAPNGQAGMDIFNDFRAADDFRFTGSLSIDLIRFWGLLPTGLTYTPTIFWEILHDTGSGVPGTSVARGSTFASTTRRTSLDGLGFDSWQFDLAVNPLLLGPGIYWLALHDGAIGDITDSTLLWEATSNANGSDFAVEFTPTGEWTGNWDNNLAFELHNTTVTPEPITLTLLGTGLLGLAGARRRQRKRSSERHSTIAP
jgi:hypothetical protein